MTTGPFPICLACARRQDDGCEAFPDRIPESIWVYGFDHRKPYPGDGGMTFLLNPEKADVLTSFDERPQAWRRAPPLGSRSCVDCSGP